MTIEYHYEPGQVIFINDPTETPPDMLMGRKNDQHKLRMDLIPPEALEELAKVLTFGASKYADRNWELGIKWSRIFGALMRHLVNWFKGETKDPETGLSTLSHALCNLVFLVTYEQRKMKEFDDLHRK